MITTSTFGPHINVSAEVIDNEDDHHVLDITAEFFMEWCEMFGVDTDEQHYETVTTTPPTKATA